MFDNSHQIQSKKYRQKRAYRDRKRQSDKELRFRLHQEAIMCITSPIDFGPEFFAEIEAVVAVKNDRCDAPIPAISANAAHDAEGQPQLKLIFTQSNFPIGGNLLDPAAASLRRVAVSMAVTVSVPAAVLWCDPRSRNHTQSLRALWAVRGKNDRRSRRGRRPPETGERSGSSFLCRNAELLISFWKLSWPSRIGRAMAPARLIC